MLIKLKSQKIRIFGSESVAKLVKSILAREHEFDRDKEHMFAIGLTQSSHVKYVDMVSLGSLKGTIAQPREVFRMAVHRASASIIIAHNHPSHNCKPSNTDIITTRELVAAGKILRIEIIDHIIVSEVSYYSFSDEGLLLGDK